MAKSDKGKWFTDEKNKSFIKCSTDNLLDLLITIFKGDRKKAVERRNMLRQVTFEEYVNFSLYKD